MEGFVLHILKLNLITAAVILLVKLFGGFLKNRFTARWKYIVWLVLAFSLMIPVRLPANLSLWNFRIETTAEHQTDASNAPIESTISQTAANFDGSAITPSDSAAASASLPALTVHADRGKARFISILFLSIWLTIAVLKITGELLSYMLSIRNLRRMSLPTDRLVTKRMYLAVCRDMHIRRPPELMQNAGLSTPLLAGLFHPMLCLPPVGYTAEELKLIFYHELTHYRHRDLWYKMLLRICADLYWFNPALLLMLREADKDIENLCDTGVIRACRGNDLKLYRKLLLKTVALQAHIPYATASLNDSSMVFKERILYMLNLKKLRRSILPGILLTALLLVMNAGLFFSVQAQPATSHTAEDPRYTDAPAFIPAGTDTAPVIPTDQSGNTATPPQSEASDNASLSSGIQNIPQDDSHTISPEDNVPGEDIISDTADSTAAPQYSEPDDANNNDAEDNAGDISSAAPSYNFTVVDQNGNQRVLTAMDDGTYLDDSGASYTDNNNESYNAPDGSTWSSLNDATHFLGVELATYDLTDSNGNLLTVTQTTNGDYLYRDENGSGFIDNGDGTWRDENGNTYTE